MCQTPLYSAIFETSLMASVEKPPLPESVMFPTMWKMGR
jgi:hypothetical protein